jgi:hypothetical protein
MIKRSKSLTNRVSAIRLFIDKLVRRAYLGTIQDKLSLLSGTDDSALTSDSDKQLRQWFITLSRDQQKYVEQIIEMTAYSAIFQTLTVIDGVAGTLIAGQNTHLSLSLQLYPDDESWHKRSPSVSYELNPADGSVDELHIHFFAAVKKALNKKTL